MRNLVVLCGAVFALSTSLFGGPCSPGTFQDYIDLGSTGCTIGTSTFFDFRPGLLSTGATEIAPGSIAVTPFGGPSNPGFDFAVNATAGPGELLEAMLAYSATGGGFVNATLAMSGSFAAPDGAVTVVEDLCLGGTFFPFEPSGCTGVPLTLIVFDIGIDRDTSEGAQFAAVGLLDVFKDIVVDGGLSGSGQLGSASNQFVVPEPATFLPAGAAILAFGLLVRHRRRR
jgi:hypothetical protein